MKDEVDFLPVDERQRFLQNDFTTLGVCGKTCPNPKITSLLLYFFAISLRKKLIKLIF